MAKKVLVVRITPQHVYIANMEQGVQRPTLFGYVTVPTPEGTMDDGMVLDIPTVAKTITDAWSAQGWKTNDIIFDIVSSKIASRETSVPVGDKKKFDQYADAQIRELFPVDPARYTFSYVLQGEEHAAGEDGDGMVQDVIAYAIPTEILDSYYTLADSMNAGIFALEADGNSLFQIMRRQVKSGVSMSIQVNKDNSSISIMSNERMLLQRVIPYGITVFTDLMVQADEFNSKSYEEAYKSLTGSHLILERLNSPNPAEDAELARRIALTDNSDLLIGNISRVIEYYNSRYRDMPINQILCIGPGSHIGGFQKLLANELGIEVITPDNLEDIKRAKGFFPDKDYLTYLNCYGAVFNPVGFKSEAVAEKEAKKGSMVGPVAIFVVCLALAVVLSGFSITMLLFAQNENNEWKKKEQSLQHYQDEFNELTEKEGVYQSARKIGDVVDTHNNHLHEFIDQLQLAMPKSFIVLGMTSGEESLSLTVQTDADLDEVAAAIRLIKHVNGYNTSEQMIGSLPNSVIEEEDILKLLDLAKGSKLKLRNISVQSVARSGEGGKPQWTYSINASWDNTSSNKAFVPAPTPTPVPAADETAESEE